MNWIYGVQYVWEQFKFELDTLNVVYFFNVIEDTFSLLSQKDI